MTAITLRNMPNELRAAIETKARSEKLSLNKAVQVLLEEAVGVKPSPNRKVYDDLDHLAGTWSDEEASEFDAALREQRNIDLELWD